MKREIKFRGKRIYNGEWVYGYYLVKAEKHIIYSRADIASCYVIPESVGQFTGLKDKNGKEIYEGDIITSCHNEATKLVQYGLFNDDWENPESRSIGFYVGKNVGLGLDIYGNMVIEVIGKFYENPELLKC